MSSEVNKPRFSMLKGVRDSAQAVAEAQTLQEAPVAPAASPEPSPAVKDDSVQEPFSCTLSRGRKRRLKKASADEDRKQYLLVEQALTEYLSRNHPDIK